MGLKIRIDTNLIGFEGTTPIWQNSTILFHGDGKRKGQLIVLNNDDKTYHIVSSLKTFDVQKLLKQHEIKTHISTTKLQCKKTGEIVEKYGFTCHEYIINDIPYEQIISKQKVVSSRFLMARNHPINLTTFINLLQLVSGTDHYNKLIKFSKNVLTDSMGFPISIFGIATTVIAMIHLQELFIVVGGFYSGSIMNIALNARLIGSFMLVVLSFIAYFKQLKACFMLMTGYSLTFCSMFVHENSFVLILLNNTAFDIFSVIGNIIWFVFFYYCYLVVLQTKLVKIINLSLCMYEFFVVFHPTISIYKTISIIRYIGVFD
ncbi:hypothetical protein QTN25_005792 [Entamoeba marina]